MPSGSGGSLGAAIIALIGAHAGTPKSSYRATGWHAQLRQLTGVKGGSAAADAVGLDVTARTLTAWLSESQHPSARNQGLIDRAYQHLAGRGFPDALRRAQLEISGVVAIGNDVRDRGGTDGSAFRIDGSLGDWDRIAEAWENGEDDEDLYEDLFYEDVWEGDVGELTDEVSFPGSWYTVTS